MNHVPTLSTCVIIFVILRFIEHYKPFAYFIVRMLSDTHVLLLFCMGVTTTRRWLHLGKATHEW